MKIAICLHGLIGSIKGKNFENKGGSDEVLTKTHMSNNIIIDKYNADVFVHSWSTDMGKEIVEVYNPKSYKIEEQVQFEVPSYIKAKHNRAFAHLSRWYSYKHVINELRAYEKKNGIKYDFVMVQRFDLVWKTIPMFETMDPNTFYVGNSLLNPQKEWSDRVFISNSDNMEKFATLFDEIDTYMKPGGELPSVKQWSGISSHFLSRHHANKLKLRVDYKYNYKTDYNEVRNEYYGK
jgi:hypothetical protein